MTKENDMTDSKDALIKLLAHVVGSGDAPSQAEWGSAFDSLIKGRPSEHYYPILRDQARLAFMGSLDAAKALHEAVLPGWRVKTILEQHSRWYVCIYQDMGDDWPKWTPYPQEDAASPTPARAWLIAILQALIAGEDTNANDKGE
jgi:hypothetical protein